MVFGYEEPTGLALSRACRNEEPHVPGQLLQNLHFLPKARQMLG